GTTEVGAISGGVVSSESYRRGYVGNLTQGLEILSAGTRDEPAPVVLAYDPAAFAKYIVDGKVVEHDSPAYPLPDLGYVEDGALFLIGRADEVYNYSGNKRSYDQIAAEIARFAGVRDVSMASGAPIGRENDLIIAVVA